MHIIFEDSTWEEHSTVQTCLGSTEYAVNYKSNNRDEDLVTCRLVKKELWPNQTLFMFHGKQRTSGSSQNASCYEQANSKVLFSQSYPCETGYIFQCYLQVGFLKLNFTRHVLTSDLQLVFSCGVTLFILPVPSYDTHNSSRSTPATLFFT